MNCEHCQNKKCLKTGKPCEEIEDILRNNKIWGRDWIRPRVSSKRAKREGGKWREIPFSSLNIKDDLTGD